MVEEKNEFLKTEHNQEIMRRKVRREVNWKRLSSERTVHTVA